MKLGRLVVLLTGARRVRWAAHRALKRMTQCCGLDEGLRLAIHGSKSK